MGTYASLCAPIKQKKVIEEGFNRLKSVEQSLSSYSKNAYIYKLNKNLHVNLNIDTYEALLKSYRYYILSDGYFNIMIGSITKKIYRFGDNEHLAKESELDSASVLIDGIDFNEEEARLTSNSSVDLGGMGKGFGVDKVHEIYKHQNIKEGKIALSGDIRCVSTCKISITNPFKPHKAIATFNTKHKGMGISTSGNYYRYVQNKRHNHLINPKIKRSAIIFASITLIGNISSSDLDAYATAASVMPLQQAISFLNSQRLGYILFTTDATKIVSSNIDQFVNNLCIEPSY
ncbi:MAG: FAD:protein FMN transferase [Bacteroidota bacterium]|nr:FAD:protein FMN transferase [Bacteroidota bacterium]